LNEGEFPERGGVSQNVWPSLRIYEDRAVRSPDAQLPGPLSSTRHVGRLMGSSSTAKQYNISVTEALPAEANVCQLGGAPSPISAQPTSGLSHLSTPETRGILKFFSTGSERHAHAWQTSSGLGQTDASSGENVRGGGQDVIRRNVAVAKVCITDRCVAAPVRQKRNWRLTSRQYQCKELGPQPVYFFLSFFQPPPSQVTPFHS
jgi:hypothetical protein